MKYEPMRHQQIAYDFCMRHERAGLFLGMGLGKTATSLTVLATYLWDTFTVRKALVIAPKNVAQNVWAQECRKWDHTQGIRCSVILGTEKQRLAALNADADLYIINRENVCWLLDTLKGKLPFDMVILDELSSFKSQTSKRWKVLKKVIGSVRYVIGLTGTPAPNGYLDLWAQIFLLDGGQRLGRRITEYRERYFKPGAHKGHIVYEWKLRMGAKETIDRSLRDMCLSMCGADWLDLPPIIYNTIPVSMDKKARETYDKLKKEKVIPLLQKAGDFEQLDPYKDEDLEKMTSVIQGDTAAAIAGKLLQMANGAVYDDGRNVVPIHEVKLDALAEIIDTNPGENLLVFYNYQHDKERILARFPKAREFTGPQDVEDWNKGKVPILLCHPASCGHGLNLQHGGHIIVWYGLTWSLELYQQANARLPRPGQKQSVIIHHIVCKNTLDERVMAVLHERDETQSGLLNALKGYLKKEEK
jgi:SNF2 family DNA or RNA helicase